LNGTISNVLLDDLQQQWRRSRLTRERRAVSLHYLSFLFSQLRLVINSSDATGKFIFISFMNEA